MWMYPIDEGMSAALLIRSATARLVAVAVLTLLGSTTAHAQPPSGLDLQAPPKPLRACVVNDADIRFLSDQGLSMKLASRLQFNRALLMESVDVRVVGAVAILEGRLSTARQVDTAVRIARETGGIRCVINELTVTGQAR